MAETNRQLLARVWRPLLKKFNSIIEGACLRRDAYLNHVFAHEARALKDEIPCANSDEARAHLQRKLEDLDRVPVNFSLSAETVMAVTRACGGLNVNRDCFINRVLFLLVADVTICEAIIGIEIRRHLADVLGDHDRDYLYSPVWAGSVHAISGIVGNDPFWALRNVIGHFQSKAEEFARPLHACLITPDLFSQKPTGVMALNCYLPDELIPNSSASKRAFKELDELLGGCTDSRPQPQRTNGR